MSRLYPFHLPFKKKYVQTIYLVFLLLLLLIDSVVLMNTKANSKEYNFLTVLKRTLLINIQHPVLS